MFLLILYSWSVDMPVRRELNLIDESILSNSLEMLEVRDLLQDFKYFFQKNIIY